MAGGFLLFAQIFVLLLEISQGLLINTVFVLYMTSQF